MGSLQDIADPRGRKGLVEAAKLDAEAVRTVVVAETESGLASAIGNLREQLERRGWGRDKIDRTVRAARKIQAARTLADARANRPSRWTI